MVMIAGSLSGTGMTSGRAFAWVVSFVSSGTLTCAIVIPILAEHGREKRYRLVLRGPRATQDLPVDSDLPFTIRVLRGLLREPFSATFPVFPVSILESTLRIVHLLGHLYLHLNKSNFTRSFAGSSCDVSLAFLEISGYPPAPVSVATTQTARMKASSCCLPRLSRGSPTDSSISRRLEISASGTDPEPASQPNLTASRKNARIAPDGLLIMNEGSPGLRAGKSPAFLDSRGLLRSGRSRTAKSGMRIFSRNVARASSGRSGVKGRDGVRPGGESVREADPCGRDASRGRADPDNLA